MSVEMIIFIYDSLNVLSVPETTTFSLWLKQFIVKLSNIELKESIYYVQKHFLMNPHK